MWSTIVVPRFQRVTNSRIYLHYIGFYSLRLSHVRACVCVCSFLLSLHSRSLAIIRARTSKSKFLICNVCEYHSESTAWLAYSPINPAAISHCTYGSPLLAARIRKVQTWYASACALRKSGHNFRQRSLDRIACTICAQIAHAAEPNIYALRQSI